jgi:hypothetical protein
LATKEVVVASRQRIVSHLLYHQGISLPQTTWLSTPTHLTVLCHPPPLKTKLEGRHFGTIGVIGAESWAVLNTITEHDLQGDTGQ